MPRILLLLGLWWLALTPAAARMYQWQNPATGTTQLSGTPPVWYRSAEPGPRVYVFDNNQLVDDTGIAVSDAQRESLRAAAFGAAEQHEASISAAPATPQPVTPAAPAAIPAPETSADAPKLSTDTGMSDKAAALKALIDAWDQRQLDHARSLLDMMPSDGKASTTPR